MNLIYAKGRLGFFSVAFGIFILAKRTIPRGGGAMHSVKKWSLRVPSLGFRE